MESHTNALLSTVLTLHVHCFSFVRKLKDFSIHYSSDGSISISDSLLIQVSGDEDETKSVLVSWSHQVSQYYSSI